MTVIDHRPVQSPDKLSALIEKALTGPEFPRLAFGVVITGSGADSRVTVEVRNLTDRQILNRRTGNLTPGAERITSQVNDIVWAHIPHLPPGTFVTVLFEDNARRDLRLRMERINEDAENLTAFAGKFICGGYETLMQGWGERGSNAALIATMRAAEVIEKHADAFRGAGYAVDINDRDRRTGKAQKVTVRARKR